MKNKILYATATCLAFTFFVGGQISEAEEVNSQQTIEYDLNDTGIEHLSYIDENGEQIELSVEKVSAPTRIANGTYRVSKTFSGATSVSYNVTTRNNKFTGASGLSVYSGSGTIISRNLTCSTYSARGSFVRRAGAINVSGAANASLVNGSLRVS